MISNSQIIIVLLIILILIQLYQFYLESSKESFHTDGYGKVNYNRRFMSCDGNSGMLNSKCIVRSNLPKVEEVCNKKLKMMDGPNYDTNEGKFINYQTQGSLQPIEEIEGIENKVKKNKERKERKEKKEKKVKILEADDDNSLLNEIKSVGELEN